MQIIDGGKYRLTDYGTLASLTDHDTGESLIVYMDEVIELRNMIEQIRHWLPELGEEDALEYAWRQAGYSKLARRIAR